MQYTSTCSTQTTLLKAAFYDTDIDTDILARMSVSWNAALILHSPWGKGNGAQRYPKGTGHPNISSVICSFFTTYDHFFIPDDQLHSTRISFGAQWGHGAMVHVVRPLPPPLYAPAQQPLLD